MAIAYDNVLNDSAVTGSTDTRAFTITGSNTALVVAIQHTSARTVSSVTYAGVNLTQIHANIVGEGTARVDLWLLVGTATGSNNIVITMSGSDNFRSSATSYTGVGDGGGTGKSDSGTTVSWSGSTATQTATWTTVNDNCWAVGYWRSQNSYAPSTNVTARQNISGVLCIEDTNGALTPAGSKSKVITYSSGGAGAGAWVVVALAPYVVASSTNSNFFGLM